MRNVDSLTLAILCSTVIFGSGVMLGSFSVPSVVLARVEARDPKQVDAFRRNFPCPNTGLLTGACHGWVVDHKYPLCAGGADHPSNMQWQQADQAYIKDRIERELCACKGAKT